MSLFHSKKRKTAPDVSSMRLSSSEVIKQESPKKGTGNRSIISLLTPNGIDVSNPEYLVIDDAGRTIYGVGLYIDKIPNNLDIAIHFAPLFNYQNVTPSVFIEPLMEESKNVVNKRINMLDGELYGATKDDSSRNRARELEGKLADAERWARILDSGENMLYNVAFLFWLTADSREELINCVTDFEGVAKKKGFELAACYGAHLEAFLSTYPMNRIYGIKYKNQAAELLLKQQIVKWHKLDKRSLSTIYNHTTSEFSHKEGVPFGRNLYTSVPICFDPFDPVHTSYGMLVAGMPGYGKSTSLKCMYSRLVDFGYHFVLIDYEPLPSGQCGEYTAMVERVGGVSYQISTRKSGCRLNLFEINEEIEYNDRTGEEYRTLHLADKIVDLTNILLVMATSSRITNKESVYSAETISRMRSIIAKCVKILFERLGIVENDASSLWYYGENSFARVRKPLPTMHDFYVTMLYECAANTDEFKKDAYSLLLDVFEEMVEELYYNPATLQEYTREEYERLPIDKQGNRYEILKSAEYVKVRAIHGSRAYFDCQSNVAIDVNLPAVSFDISLIPSADRPLLMLVCQNFVEEHFIKTNSSNPKVAKKLIFSMDEAHRSMPFEDARTFLNALYRLARKRHVAPVLIMQSIADLSKYPDTEDIIKNTETLLLFKHNYSDREYIKKVTKLSDSQIDTILNLGGNQQSEKKRPGELAIIEVPTKRCVFLLADYLKETESEIAETDAEVIASRYRKQNM